MVGRLDAHTSRKDLLGRHTAAEVVDIVEQDHAKSVEDARESWQAVQQELEEASKTVAARGEEATAAKAVKEEKHEALRSAKKEVSAAKDAVAAAKRKEESLETERAAVVAEGAEYEGLLEGDWAILKVHNLEGKNIRPTKSTNLIMSCFSILQTGDLSIPRRKKPLKFPLIWTSPRRLAAWMGRSGVNAPNSLTLPLRCWNPWVLTML